MERFPGLSGTLLRVDSADGTVTECELSDIPRLLADTSG